MSTAPQLNSIPDPTPGQPGTAEVHQLGVLRPAGFWIRFVALVIDAMILSIVTYPLIFGAAFALGLGQAVTDPQQAAQGDVGMVFAYQALTWGITLAGTFFYYGWFYRNKGATPGKLLFGMKVLDARSGTHLRSYWRTFAREIVGKTLSGLTLTIGYLMAGFRQDKRALHDFLAGSRVVRK